MNNPTSSPIEKNSQEVNVKLVSKEKDIRAKLLTETDPAKIDALKKEAENWAFARLIFGSITGGLSGNGLGGTIAKAAAPFVAQQIGEYFKPDHLGDKDKQGTPAHLLAHAILGAAVAAANGDNPLAGGLSAATAEGAASSLSKWLFKEDDPSKLTAEQKSTISSIVGLAGNAIGGVIGGDNNIIAGGKAARTAFDNNRALGQEDEITKSKIVVLKPDPRHPNETLVENC